jgi:hypothetical protein
LIDVKIVIVERGRLSLSFTYSIRKGQIILAPVVLINIPQNISRN